MLIITFVFINLFIAVILQAFDESEQIQESKLVGEHWEQFKEVWYNFDPEATGFLEATKLEALLCELQHPLGYKNSPINEKLKLQKYISQLSLPIFADNTYHYVEICSALSRWVYAVDRGLTFMVDDLESDRVIAIRNQRKPIGKPVEENYNSSDVLKVMKMQNRIRTWLENIRKNREERNNTSRNGLLEESSIRHLTSRDQIRHTNTIQDMEHEYSQVIPFDEDFEEEPLTDRVKH